MDVDAVVTKLAAIPASLPPDVKDFVFRAEFWMFYVPLMYVSVLPLFNLIVAVFKECLRTAARRRGRRIIKKLGHVGLAVSPNKYQDLEKGKGKKGGKPKKGLQA